MTTIYDTPQFSLQKLLKKDTTSADLIFGSVAGFFGRFIEHPFDTVKVRLQTTNDFKNARECMSKTYRKEGFNAFYKGLSAPLYGSIVENAIIFASYTFFQRKINQFYQKPAENELTIPQLCVAGALAGSTISFIMTPVELIKCNLQVQDLSKVNGQTNKYSGPLSVIAQTLREKGVFGMFQGQTSTLLREAFGNAAWFGSYEIACNFFMERHQRDLNRLVKREDLSATELLMAGALAGSSYQAAFFPADVVKSRQQTVEVLEGVNKSFLQISKDLYREQGVKGFFRGFAMTISRSAPTSACIFLTFELMKRNFAYD